MSIVADPLPTGVVTFLLTDIEGSTQAWQASPGDMTARVSRHYEILDSIIAAHGGRRPQEQGEGDSVVAVFVDPVAALKAAVDAQVALRDAVPDLPVRMALHTGDATLRNEDNYVGLTIIRCARIRGVRARRPDPGVGRHRTGHPRRVRRLARAARPGSVRARRVSMGANGSGRSPTRPARRLPAVERRSIGHRKPSAHRSARSSAGGRSWWPSARSLAANRLITLVGDVGIGKTRLARPRRLRPNSKPGGVWWVPLADLPADDTDAVAAWMMRACALAGGGRPGRGDRRPLRFDRPFAGGRRRARRRRVAVAAVIERLLGQCPDTQVLATGRSSRSTPGRGGAGGAADGDAGRGLDGGLDELEVFDATRLFLERGATTYVALTTQMHPTSPHLP